MAEGPHQGGPSPMQRCCLRRVPAVQSELASFVTVEVLSQVQLCLLSYCSFAPQPAD